MSFYQDPEDTTRLRAAYRHTLANTSDRALSDFIQRVIMAEVERLENQYNGGKPFASVRVCSRLSEPTSCRKVAPGRGVTHAPPNAAPGRPRGRTGHCEQQVWTADMKIPLDIG